MNAKSCEWPKPGPPSVAFALRRGALDAFTNPTEQEAINSCQSYIGEVMLDFP